MTSPLALFPAIAPRLTSPTAERQACMLKQAFVASILAAMAEERMTLSDVARRMNTSRQHVSRLLNFDRPTNISFETMAALADAVGYQVACTLVPSSAVNEAAEPPGKRREA